MILVEPAATLAPAVGDGQTGVGQTGVGQTGVGSLTLNAATVVPLPTLPPTATALPTPTPYGKIWSSEVFFHDQALFPLQQGALPPTLLDVDLLRESDLIPEGRSRFPLFTPYIVWLVVMDARGAGEDFVMRGTVRWLDLTFLAQPLLMHTTEVELTPESYIFFKGLGDEEGSFWDRIGDYRVELLDDRGELLLYWNFEVR